MVSEDSQHFRWLAEVHRLRDLRDFGDPLQGEVPAELHRSDDPNELDEVVSLRRSKGVRLEEGDDDVAKVAEATNAVPIHVLTVIVGPTVCIDATASENTAPFPRGRRDLKRLEPRRTLVGPANAESSCRNGRWSS
jgi:hypothetical protein